MSYFFARFDTDQCSIRTRLRLGASVLKDCIRRSGTEIDGQQRYNGAGGDATIAYARKVLGEKQRLQDAVQRMRRLA